MSKTHGLPQNPGLEIWLVNQLGIVIRVIAMGPTPWLNMIFDYGDISIYVIDWLHFLFHFNWNEKQHLPSLLFIIKPVWLIDWKYHQTGPRNILAPKLTSHACALWVCSLPPAIAATPAISQTSICKALGIDSPSHAQMNKHRHKTWSFCLKYCILSSVKQNFKTDGWYFSAMTVFVGLNPPRPLA